MPNQPTKASRLLAASETWRWCHERRQYEQAKSAALELEDLVRDFEKFAKNEKYLMDRWDARTA